MMISTRRCPTNHRHVEDDGVRVEKDVIDGTPRRSAWILSTCQECGQRFTEEWEMRRVGRRVPMPNQ